MPASSTFQGPSQSLARPYRSARRRSQVPDGGTRTMSTQSPTPFQTALGNPASASSPASSAWRAGPAASRSRTRAAAASMSTPSSSRRATLVHQSRRVLRMASVNGG